jgi:hypothetical protein
MELKGSLPCSKKPASGPYSDPNYSNPHPTPVRSIKKNVYHITLATRRILLYGSTTCGFKRRFVDVFQETSLFKILYRNQDMKM